MGQSEHDPGAKARPAWNAGRKLGAKRALKPQQVWAFRFWLDKERKRDRAMFDLAIDSKLRGCDIVKIKIGDIVLDERVRSRPTVVQHKTKRRRAKPRRHRLPALHGPGRFLPPPLQTSTRWPSFKVTTPGICR